MKKMTKYLIIFFSLSSLLEKPNKGLKNNNSHVRKQNTSWQKKKNKNKKRAVFEVHVEESDWWILETCNTMILLFAAFFLFFT